MSHSPQSLQGSGRSRHSTASDILNYLGEEVRAEYEKRFGSTGESKRNEETPDRDESPDKADCGDCCGGSAALKSRKNGASSSKGRLSTKLDALHSLPDRTHPSSSTLPWTSPFSRSQLEDTVATETSRFLLAVATLLSPLPRILLLRPPYNRPR